jgi:hypothetical protein
MMSDEVELMRAHLKVYLLESKQVHTQLTDLMGSLMVIFAELPAEGQDFLIDALDEFAQDAVRRRELFDTTLAAAKKIKENAGE